MIHGDFNEHNILVRQGEDSAWHVDGVLDFGDTQHGCYLFEVALAACYLLLQARVPLQPARAAALVVAGYHRLRPLLDQELALMQVNLIILCIIFIVF
jgi:hydroxylysine kinase